MLMKTLVHLKLAVALSMLGVASAEAQFFRSSGGGEQNNQSVLVIKSDGSSLLTNRVTQSRKTLEIQVTSWERYSKIAGGGSLDEEAIAAMAQAPKAGQKALSQEELISKVREMYAQRSEPDEEGPMKLEGLEVSSNSVCLVTTRSFASLKELFSHNPYTWGPTVLMFEDARAELDTNQNLRITFTPNQTSARYSKMMGRQWKSAKFKFEWKLVLPGKIIASGLPTTEGNATTIILDSDKPDAIDAGLKLTGQPLVITAEPGGLKLDAPLDSKSLVRAAWKQKKPEPDLPITEAGPGFQAEPVGISLSTIHYFPEGEEFIKDRPEAQGFELSQTGTVVTAKLFPPKGRTIKSVNGLRVKSAKDDQGRTIPGISVEGGADEENYQEFTSFSSDDSEQKGATQIELRMGMPAPDAKAIDELQAEAVALTVGGWKEMVLTNLQADAKKEIDLAELVPGAKLTIKKISSKKPQRSVEATVEGPRAVGQLELNIKLSSPHGQSHMNERQSKTSGNKTTRNLTIQAFEFGLDSNAEVEPMTLVVRYPQDVKRERVQFKLTALDLL